MNLLRPSRPYMFRPLLPSLSFVLALMGLATPTISAETNSPPATAPYWQPLEIDPAIYRTPYHISLFNAQNGADKERLWSQTQSIFLYGLGVFGVLAAMPENLTGWDTDGDIFRRWGKNATTGPEWDRNKWHYNYIGHAYFGGVYYQVARKSGYRQWDSFIYSALMSTFYWEYGIEGFAEVPSIQDLALTPLMGWIYGEWAFQTERQIRDRDGTVGGSKILGNLSLFFLDPIDTLGQGVNRLTGRRLVQSGTGYFTYTAAPNGNETDHQLYLNMRFPLGGSAADEPDPQNTPAPRPTKADPVDTGRVGLAIGSGRTHLDKDWGIDDGPYTKASMGLYFSPRISVRLAYAWGKLEERATGRSVNYENYSLDTQYYFRTERNLRPYLTAGFGEQIWDEDEEQITFQWNAGVGLHGRLHGKWAIQADWIHHYSFDQDTHDQQLSAGLVYRFGSGEHDRW